MGYTIGEFAELLGVTTDTIRVYEKKGIIEPIKDDKNNYRIFTDLDCRSILMSKWYRSMDVPLRDVENLVNEADRSEIISVIEKQRSTLQKQIEDKKILLSKMNDIYNDLNKIQSLLYKCFIYDKSGMYRLQQTDKIDLLDNSHRGDEVKQWMNCLPYTFYSIRIYRDELIKGKVISHYDWGLAVNENDIKVLNLNISDKVDYIPPQKCVTSIVLNTEDTAEYSVQFMLDYINENNYTICGDAFGRIILIDKYNNEKRSYMELCVPINY